MIKNKKRYIVFFLPFLITALLGGFVTVFYIKNKQALEYAQMDQLVITNANKVNSVISKLLYKTQVLSALMMQQDNQSGEFQQIAAAIVDEPCIRNVIIAPGGVVSDVYPLAGNEAVIGLNYFSEGEGNKEAIAAKDSGELVLGGPFNLVQGGMALVGRLPVYHTHENGDKTFWGIVSVTLNYPEALDGAELNTLETRGLAFEIWRLSPDTNEKQVIARSNYPYNANARYVEHAIQIHNAKWYFRLSPIREWYELPETWIFILCTMIVSILAASLFRHNYDLKIVKYELEQMTQKDTMTGLLNRRGLFSKLEELTGQDSSPFVLCYLDLNNFKDINDTYGHLAGDRVLKKFADTIANNIEKSNLSARIGGDEFILIFNNTNDPEQVKKTIKSLVQKMELIEPMESGISFCVGTAVYPDDSRSVDELLSIADSKMYEMKKQEG